LKAYFTDTDQSYCNIISRDKAKMDLVHAAHRKTYTPPSARCLSSYGKSYRPLMSAQYMLSACVSDGPRQLVRNMCLHTDVFFFLYVFIRFLFFCFSFYVYVFCIHLYYTFYNLKFMISLEIKMTKI
jgi:hypothetical protein